MSPMPSKPMSAQRWTIRPCDRCGDESYCQCGLEQCGHPYDHPEVEVIRASEYDRLRQFVEWVAAHKFAKGIYADDDHPYEEWYAPDGSEMEFDDVYEGAREALR